MSIEVGSSVKVVGGEKALSTCGNNTSKEVVEVDRQAGKVVCQWVEDGETKVGEFEITTLVPFMTKVSMR